MFQSGSIHRMSWSWTALAAALLVIATLYSVRTVVPSNDSTAASFVALDRAVSESASDSVTSDRYTALPLYFEENYGQFDSQALYMARAGGFSMFVTPNRMAINLALERNPQVESNDFEPQLQRSTSASTPARSYGLYVDFIGASEEVSVYGEDVQPGVSSYFRGSRDEWITDVPHFGAVRYDDLYTGIDAVFYGNPRQLQYDFIVAPYANPSQIRLRFDPVESLTLSEDGDLQVWLGARSLTMEAPYTYQIVDGVEHPVDSRFVVDGTDVIFELGDYDSALPLVIDPVLAYAGYIGGGGYDLIQGVALDSAGYAYIAGYTASTEVTFPVTVGPDLTYNGGPSDAFVAKVSPDGSTLVYASYIGGSGSGSGESASDIAVDSTGNAYVTGTVVSDASGFPVISGPDLTYNGGNSDAFVAKINDTGTSLIFAGFIGGSGTENATSIALDSMKNVYIAGETTSTESSFPVAGGLDSTHNGMADGYIAKIQSDGTAIIYAGFIGGSHNDFPQGIAVNSLGEVYVTGVTVTNSSFPVLTGPDLLYNGGTSDGFVAKVNGSGTTLIFSGYIGGSGTDAPSDIALDSLGNAYITGRTDSADFPVVSGLDLTYNGGTDSFVVKVDATGTNLVYAGYIGGSGYDAGYGIVVNDAGEVLIAGETISDESTFPVLVGPDLTHNGSYDAFVVRVSAAGEAIIHAGFIGGDSWEFVRDVAIDNNGNVILVGETGSSEATFPVLNGPDLTHNGIADGFIAKISDPLPQVSVTETGGDTEVVEGGTTDSYSVVLNTAPSDDVTVTPIGDADCSVSAALTFTSVNWMVAQDITVTAINDAIAEGTHSCTITNTATSGDTDYNGIFVVSVIGMVTDDDTAGVSIVPTAVDVTEGGAIATYAVSLTSQPTSDVTVTPAGDADCSISSALTFTSANWMTGQDITVTAVNDGLVEGEHGCSITNAVSSSDPVYDGISAPSVSGTVTDNDIVGISVAPASVNIAEGGATGSYAVFLTSQPSSDVTVTPTGDADCSVNGALVFTSGNWMTAQDITITAVNDSIAEGTHSCAVTNASTSGDANYDGIAVASVNGTVTDNDTAGVNVVPTVSVAEGGATDTYSVVLTSQPIDDVTITPTGDTQCTVSGALTFTALTWDTPQTVTVTAVDDDIAEGDHTCTVTHASVSDDTNYEGIAVASVTGSITDNDGAGVSITPTNADITEGGATDTYSVVLTSQPIDDVTITPTGDTQCTVSGVLTFTAITWDTQQFVTVTAIDDAIAEGAHTCTVTHAATSADPGYDAISVASVTGSITDDDPFPAELLVNGGFELHTVSNKIPDGWTVNNATVDKLLCKPGKPHAGLCAFSFSGSVGEKAQLSQTVNLTGVTADAGDTLTLSAYFKGNDTTAKTQLHLIVTYTGNPTPVRSKITVRRNAAYTLVSLPALTLSGPVEKIKVMFKHKSTTGKVLIDDVSLIHTIPGGRGSGALPLPSVDGFRGDR